LNWGLRDYGIEPIIWDGDKDCEHEWGNNIHRGRIGWEATPEGQKQFKNAITENYQSNSCFCLKCNAWKGSLGLEPTFELYLKHLCDIFDEAKRVLRKDGTCWVNIGTTMQNKNDVMIPERFAIEMTNQNYVLRDGLTKKEKEYVLTTLINNGII